MILRIPALYRRRRALSIVSMKISESVTSCCHCNVATGFLQLIKGIRQPESGKYSGYISIKKFFCMNIGLLGLLFGSAATAQQQSTSLLDSVHDAVSQRFLDFANDLDGLFGGSDLSIDANSSWFRLRTDGVRFEGDDFEARANVKMRLVLPSAEKRLRLLISTEDEDNLDPDQSRTRSTINNDENNVSFALRFLQSVRDSDALKFDIGARVRDGEGQAFARVNASRELYRNIDSGLAVTLTNNLWLFSASGFENRLRLGIRQTLPWFSKAFALSRTEVVWQNGEGGADLSEWVGLFYQLNDEALLAFESITDIASSPPQDSRDHVRAFEVRLRYRDSVWREWFFYEIWPRVRWEAEDDFRTRYGLQLRAEIFVGR